MPREKEQEQQIEEKQNIPVGNQTFSQPVNDTIKSAAFDAKPQGIYEPMPEPTTPDEE